MTVLQQTASAKTSSRQLASARDPIAWAIVALCLTIASIWAWWIFGNSHDTPARHLTGAISLPGSLILAACVLRLRSDKRLDHRTRQAWTLFLVAGCSYWIGSIARLAVAWGGMQMLDPFSAIFETATYPIALTALAMLPWRGRSGYDIALFTLDILICTWSAFVLTWHVVMFPIARESGMGDYTTAVAVAYPVADFALICTMLALVVRGMRASTQAALSAGVVGMTFAWIGDMICGTEVARGSYVPGGWSGLFYSAAWAGLALGTYFQWRVPDDDRPFRGLVDYARSAPWLPSIAVAVAFTVPVVRDWNDADMLRQHMPATGLLMALVMARLAITARQNASLAVAERERLAAAVAQSAEAIVTTDRKGVINYVNAAFTRITGFAAEEAIGRDASFLRADANPDLLADMNAALARGDSWQGRLSETRRDGGLAEVDLAVAPLRDATGATVGAVEVARDISHERALEDKLNEAQRMEAVGRLAGGIAHDFNNILTAISGFSELAAAEVEPEAEVAVDLAEILKASDRAASLTRALLAFSRQQVMQPRPVNVNEVLAGLTPMLNLLMGEDVDLAIEMAPDLGPAVTDRAQFEQVILNLATNARDAMPGGGKLVISTANVELTEAEARAHVGATAGAHIRLTVADTGSGMTREVLIHAFEPFFTTKARGKGTGLGLSTVIGVVQQSGGFVDVVTAPGEGATFSVFLPRIEGFVATEEAAAPRNPDVGGHETVLVAEDEEAVRVFVERILSRAGYQVLAAANGPEALALAAGLPHLDLLFTDMVMPGINGRELSERLARTHKGFRTIIASGYSDDVLSVNEADEVAYLPKPFTSDRVLRLVRDILDERD